MSNWGRHFPERGSEEGSVHTLRGLYSLTAQLNRDWWAAKQWARLFNQEGPCSILEKPSKTPRALPTPLMDVHVVMELCYTHRGDGIASNYLPAWSQNRSSVYPAMSYGAVSPGIFVKKCSRLLPTTPAKKKLGCMSELQTGRRALKVHQSAILDPGQRAMCITGQNS